jgi:DNA-binding PadR family transcriptional regulator
LGNLYRFVEPVLLFLIKRRGRSYGYELASDLPEYALTGAEIEVAALYRTLRQLEENGCVESEWDLEHTGPARRVYRLSQHGEEHLKEWMQVLDYMSDAMQRLIGGYRERGGSTEDAAAEIVTVNSGG